MNMNVLFPERPKRMETDDDVLMLKKEFLRKGCLPSTKFVKIGGTNVTDASCEKLKIDRDGESKTPDQRPQVLFDIMERDIGEFHAPVIHQTPKVFAPKKFGMIKESSKNSIFLQHLKHNELLRKPSSQPTFKMSDEPLNAPHSCVIDGSGLGKAIGGSEALNLHNENIQKVAAMSAEEIVRCQEELTSILSQDKINFLKGRRKKVPSHVTAKSAATSSTDKEVRIQYPLSGDSEELILKESGGAFQDGIILEEMKDNDLMTSNNGLKNRHFAETCQTIPDVKLELPINLEDCGRWLNMDVLETDKLAWMTSLPKPKPIDTMTGFTARFDFEGKLLHRQVDFPTQIGLHHHSNEPEVAGYSIEELFLLSRSSFQSQRITALETLAHILENYWDGRFDNCFDCSLLTTMLQAGLVPLLRWTLDDSSVSSIASAILAIHRLLVCKTDELCLDWCYCWPSGHLSPFFSAENMESSPNLDELTDANVIKLDVITGFLRMDILPRFRYILRVLCPSTSVCQLLIEICVRIARHSVSSAKEIAECPFLMDTIFQKFLPINWTYQEKNANTAKYFCPLASAVKLVRVISSASKQLAFIMIKNHHIRESLECYLVTDPSDQLLPFSQIQKLMIESLKLWQTLLSYGFCTDIFVHLFPVLYRQLLFCEKLYLRSSIERNEANHEYAAHLIKAMEFVITATHYVTDKSAISVNEDVVCKEDLDCMFKIIGNCLQHWLQEFPIEETSIYANTMLASAINFISTYHLSCHNGQHNMALIDENLKIYWQRFLSSDNLSKMFNSLSSHSLLLCNEKSGCQRDSKGLPSLGSVLWNSDLSPFFHKSSPFPLVLAMFKYLDTLGKNFQKAIQTEALHTLTISPIKDYLSEFASLKRPFTNWFCHFEVELLCCMVDLYKGKISIEAELLYRLSVNLAPHIFSPYETLLHRLFETVIFNKLVLRNICKIPRIPEEENLAEICCFYSNYFISPKRLKESRIFLEKNGLASLSFEMRDGILPLIGWSLLPLFNLYKVSKSRTTEEHASPENYSIITNSLRWLLSNKENERWLSVTTVPMVIQFLHLCIVYLIDSESFLNEVVKDLLSSCLCNILKQCTKLDLLHIKWEDTPTFEEIYIEMLVQFEAVSYGDELFSNFILIPLQQCYPSSWKLMLLADHEQILYFLSIPLDKLVISIEAFLEPHEKDENLLQKYLMLVASDKITAKRCPLLYLMAIHHVHHHLFTNNNINVDFWKRSMHQMAHKEVFQHIKNYPG